MTSTFSGKNRRLRASALVAIIVVAGTVFWIGRRDGKAAEGRAFQGNPPGKIADRATHDPFAPSPRSRRNDESQVTPEEYLEAVLAELRAGRSAEDSGLRATDVKWTAEGFEFVIRGLWDSGIRTEAWESEVGYLFSLMSSDHVAETLALMENLTEFQGSETRFPPRISRNMATMAGKNPEAVADWMIRHPESEFLPRADEVAGCVLVMMAQKDRGLAWETMGRLPLKDRAGMIRAIAQGAIENGDRSEVVAEMRRRVSAGAEGSEAVIWKTGTLEGLGESLSGSYHTMSHWGSQSGNAGETLRWLEAQHFTEEEIATIAGSVRPSGMSRDVAQWVEWLKEHATTEQMPGKIGEMVEYWAGKENINRDTVGDQGPEEAEKWIAAQENTVVRNAAVEGFVRAALEEGKQDDAERVARLLPDGEMRDRLLEKIRTSADSSPGN